MFILTLFVSFFCFRVILIIIVDTSFSYIIIYLLVLRLRLYSIFFLEPRYVFLLFLTVYHLINLIFLLISEFVIKLYITPIGKVFFRVLVVWSGFLRKE